MQGRINGLYAAAQRAAKGEPQAEETDIPPNAPDDLTEEQADRENDTAGDRLYLFGPDRKPPSERYEQPDTTCKELLQEYEDELPASGEPPAPRKVEKDTECRAELKALGSVGPPEGSVVIKVPQGIVILEDEESTQDLGPASPRFYYVLEDDSELSGSDIKNPEQNFDPNTNEPIVTMEFTDNGRRRFANVTKRIAERGSEQIKPIGADPAVHTSSASRSRWTTRSSRSRRSTTSRTRRASTAGRARRSTASATWRTRRTSLRTCASARCRST